MSKFKKKKVRENKGDILYQIKEDRRILSNVPDKTKIRTNIDRRGNTNKNTSKNINDYIADKERGIRYKVNYNVEVSYKIKGIKKRFYTKGIDISMTGILLEVADYNDAMDIKEAKEIYIKFEITPGTMPEGLEMRVKTKARLVRMEQEGKDIFFCGMVFSQPLSEYVSRRKGRYMLVISSLLLFAVTATILLMRAESIIYFKFNKWLYLYSIMAACFLLSRYFFGALYKEVPIDTTYTPGVSIIIPCFNEEIWIQKTIRSCINQDYPIDKLEVIVVDDCSTDKSVKQIKEIVKSL